jgi:penicillin-binding protein 2
MDITTVREPEPGNHVYLTIDLGLQVATEHALRTQIDILTKEREIKRELGETDPDIDDVITGGAVVVTDVRTGEVLASATYPTYDPMTLARDFALISSDPTMPLFNRATQGRYNPGSTYKMITAFTGLRNGTINRHLGVNDEGRYLRYEDLDFTPSCWIYSSHRATHGIVDVVRALECSCNYFFIWVADNLGNSAANNARALAATAMEFGLGVSTGLELPETTGRLATPEWKQEALKEGWWSADTLLAGFGQGHNMFTPVQLANYAATIANGGTRNRLTLLRRIMSFDYSELLYLQEPEALSTIAETEHVEILQEGMLAVTRGSRGTARSVFVDYPVRVAAKTGTVQVEGQAMNDGVFICYAPANNPEIAISIVVEKGGSGSAVMDIARMIFDYYFKTEITVLATPYGELIP